MVKTMRATKKMIIVAFDISQAKKRRQIVTMLLKYGKRINKSVFECLLTESQYKKVVVRLRMLCGKGDSVVIMPICINCYAKMEFIPPRIEETAELVKVLS